MARYDDLDTKFILFATLISCLLLVAILQGTQALSYYMGNAAQAKKLQESEYTKSNAVIREQLESLSGYQRVPLPPVTGPDGKPVAGEPLSRLQIPLERARELLIQEAKSGKTKAGWGI
jgi:hypothetical protein